MVLNGIGLCFCCHKFKLHGSQGDKVFLDRYISIVNDLIPADEQLNIIQLGNVPKIYTVSELEEKMEELQP